eukprot:1750761-Prorocentrum_lima.AAC.1
MTSSLVGSEMCIRDRCGMVWCGVVILQYHKPLRGWDGVDWDGRVGGKKGGCLLYTSDAADDM